MQNIKNIIKNINLNVISTESLEIFNKNKSIFSSENSPNPMKIVGTHSGCFHADEVLAVVMIKYIPEFENMWVIRSRNKEIHNLTDILVDVGGLYDVEKKRFDHHMKEFNYVHDETSNIKMSAAGLVFKHYGLTFIKNILINMDLFNEKIDMQKIYNKLYLNFIAYVDGQDNGINQYNTEEKPRYSNNTSYGNRIARLNPEWCEPNADQSERFKLALDVAESELFDQIKFIAKVYLPCYNFVKESVEKRFENHESGKILYFDFGLPWKSHLKTLEEEMNLKDNDILFAVVKNSEKDYRVSTIGVCEGSFEFRKGIVKSWRGLEQNKLIELSRIEDIIFVHSSGFIGGAQTRESAFRMAICSINE